ncbi:MAG: hypothetical protein M3Y33_01555 [Actinomycetota bacterium]|nr:hypothetical protein [Actinomycetota bacterium]
MSSRPPPGPAGTESEAHERARPGPGKDWEPSAWTASQHGQANQRDAIAAAVTARQHTQAMTETIGDIVVPADRS